MKVVFLAFLFAIILFVWEIATVLLEKTGLPRSKARFQAISLITSTGFTTKEAEIIMNHPQRRRISCFLMIVGPIGLTLLITIAVAPSQQISFVQISLAIISLLVLARILTSTTFENALGRLIRTKYLESKPACDVLKLDQNYALAEILVTEELGLHKRRLEETNLRAEGILILAIKKDKEYERIPAGSQTIELNDTLLAYGEMESIERLSEKHFVF